MDAYALAGNRYGYFVRAYDFAGNHSAPSDTIWLEVPTDYDLPDGTAFTLDGGVEADQGYAA